MSNDQNPKDSSWRRREGIKRRDLLLSGTSLVAAAAVSGTVLPSSAQAQEVLPFPPKPSGSTAGRTMQESVYSPRLRPRRLPDDAPNILIVLIDDVGPALPSTFGGEVNTPTMDRIAKEGIAYNRFHTTAMCSPTRAALLTGRNHHRVGNGQIAEMANDWDGYSGIIPKSSATVAEVLKNYGYATAAFGKWHNTPAERDDRRRPVRELAHRATASSISTASSPAKRRSTSRTWCATRPCVHPHHTPRKATI